jgi:hypothetical protein
MMQLAKMQADAYVVPPEIAGHNRPDERCRYHNPRGALFQPEALAVYERLKSAPTQLKAAWVSSPLPLETLELIGEAFAVRVP